MHPFIVHLIIASLVIIVDAVTPSTLNELCTDSYVRNALGACDGIQGLSLETTSVTAEIVTNNSVTSNDFPSATISNCNVTFAYSHDGINGDRVLLQVWFPEPAKFQRRRRLCHQLRVLDAAGWYHLRCCIRFD
jgi:tannase